MSLADELRESCIMESENQLRAHPKDCRNVKCRAARALEQGDFVTDLLAEHDCDDYGISMELGAALAAFDEMLEKKP